MPFLSDVVITKSGPTVANAIADKAEIDSIRPMNAILRSYHVARALSALDADNVGLARRHYDKFNSSELKIARIIALGARISLLENDSTKAKPQLLRAMELAKEKKSEKARYIVHYCRFFLALMDRNGMHEKERAQALSLKPGNFVLDTLPLPHREIKLAEVDRLNAGSNKTVH